MTMTTREDIAKLTPLMAQARLAELRNYREWAMESARWETAPNAATIGAQIDDFELEMAAIEEYLSDIHTAPPARPTRRSLLDVEAQH
jgi:hypothetical protein